MQNLSHNTNALVKVYFYNEGGSMIKSLVDWINRNRSQTFYLPAINGLPNGYRGSAKVHSWQWNPPNPPPNVSVVVNASKDYGLSGDGLASYNGFNR